ncbi:MAG: hypothetical protein HRT64_11575 [Erythrobacter sp.]|nr:hypothetical protein [Erythrobacter sp.]
MFLEDLNDPRKVSKAASEPADLVDDHDVDPACFDIGKQLLQSQSTGVAP